MTGGMAGPGWPGLGSRGNISLAGIHRKLAQGKWVGGTGELTGPGNITDLNTIEQRQATMPSSQGEIFSSDQRRNSALQMRDQVRENMRKRNNG